MKSNVSFAVLCLLFGAVFACGATKEKFFAYRSFWPETEAMKQFADAGVDTYAVMPSNSFNTLGEPYCKFPPFWVWDETYLWDIVDRQFDLVIEQNPNAKFICMIDINSPIWLLRRINRKYGMGGDSYQEISNSLCVKEWRELTEKMLKAYVKHMEEKYGDRVKYYIVAGGGTSEWYCTSKGRALPQKEELWNKWRKKNGLKECDVPSYKQLNSPSFGVYFNPETQKAVVEYARFTEEMISNGMLGFAKIVRDIVGDKKQVGAFCGFIPMQFSGKLDNSKTYTSDIVDFIGSPGGYDNRNLGNGGATDAPLKSLSLTNKHWFQEIDHRTHTYNNKLTPYVSIGGIHEHGGVNTQAGTDAILKREFSYAIVMQNSLWCFDMWGGVFKTPETMNLIKRAHRLWDMHKNDNLPYKAEVVFVIDPESGSYSKYASSSLMRKLLYATGAPFDILDFRDISKVDFSKYKVAVFPHSFEITPEKREILEKHVFKGGRTVLTIGAFGATDGEKIDVNFVKELTGFDYNTKGINRKDMGAWVSVYSGKSSVFTRKSVRKILEDAGVHMYTDEPLPVFANDRLVAVHVKNGGKKEIKLPRKAKKIVELFTEKTVGENTDKFVYDFKSPDTALFELIDE